MQHSSFLLNYFLVLFKCKGTCQRNDSNRANIAMANVTPAHTTTQLLLSNTKPSVLTQGSIINVTTITLLLNNHYHHHIPEAPLSLSINPYYGPSPLLRCEKAYILKAAAAQQPKRPVWTHSFAYLRGPRSNGDNLRKLVTELNMIRASKITRALKPRSSHLPCRKDNFIWGKASHLREIM
ncbi:MAG: hypothetical protein EXX96DRAFT_551455 [Benjaminiella poitrasii]|nr:MAG: hypothetical protein EXX96DRAFT_551455 [Benjaminiella poitrasii]